MPSLFAIKSIVLCPMTYPAALSALPLKFEGRQPIWSNFRLGFWTACIVLTGRITAEDDAEMRVWLGYLLGTTRGLSHGLITEAVPSYFTSLIKVSFESS